MEEEIQDSKRLEYIYKAMEDTTNIIISLDTKINYIFVAIGLFLALIGTVCENVLEVYRCYNSAPYISGVILYLLIAYAIFTGLSVYMGYKTLYPKNNPEDNIDFKDSNVKRLWYLTNDRNNKLQIELKQYCEEVNNLSVKDIITSVAFELMKQSYIRNIKLQTSKKCMIYFLLSVVVFSIVMIILFVHYFILL